MLVRSTALCVAALVGIAACSSESEVVVEADPAVQAKAERLDALQTPPAGEGPQLYFANLADGDMVTSPFRVTFGLSGYGVAPAGVDKENTGHHHLLIDTQLTAEEMEYAIPNDDTHRHFGGGQTEVILDLEPGSHTLQLVLGDLNHEQLDPPLMSDLITITVQ